ncbi:MAG: GGDEF domain-containing protein [Pseudomonas oryzihabitans]
MSTLSSRDRARALEDSLAQFWRVATPVVQSALAIHVGLLAVFTLFDQPLMVAANVLSVLVYILCLAALRRGRYRFTSLAMSGEIIAHACLATWQLGWESNFHYYVLCILPIVIYNYRTAPKRHLLLVLGILVTLAGGFLLHRPPGLSPAATQAFGVGNIVFSLLLLLYGTAASFHHSSKMQLNLLHSASHDSLTNLYNRRRILDQARQEEGISGSLILFDVDHFKSINDRFGHDCGDLVLQRIADVIRHEVRHSDLAARWGGEEFLVLLPKASTGVAWSVAERIRLRLAEVTETLERGPGRVTATLAVCEIRDCEVFASALERADQALYRGKQEGRDRVMLAA